MRGTMADAEIELPMTSFALRVNGSSPGISRTSVNPEVDSYNVEDTEKSPEQSEEEDKDEAEEANIVYHYLTFETALPHPTTIHPSVQGQDEPPPPPDLAKYTSPFEWSHKRKQVIIVLSCLITSLTAFAAGSYSPGAGQMTRQWHVGNVAILVGITTFTTGESSAGSSHRQVRY